MEAWDAWSFFQLWFYLFGCMPSSFWGKIEGGGGRSMVDARLYETLIAITTPYLLIKGHY